MENCKWKREVLNGKIQSLLIRDTQQTFVGLEDVLKTCLKDVFEDEKLLR